MSWRKLLGSSVLWVVVWLNLPAMAAEPDSPAQAALFDSDHLKNIQSPVRLNYSFVRRGDPSLAYEDNVVAEIRAVRPDGAKDVWIRFLRGDRQMETTPAIGFHGNPLLMYFLEHDVIEMRRETGIPAAYFRGLVRRAFFDAASTVQVTIDLAGKPQPATAINLTPFANDPNLAGLPAIAGKSYSFVLCEEVPGTLYQIGSRMPPSSEGAAVVEELMTYSGETP